VPTLVVHELGEKPRFAALDKETTTIGRDPANDVVLRSELVSRRHAELRASAAGRWSITSLAEENPLVVNGEVVEGEHALKEGTELQIGTYLLIFTHARDARRQHVGLFETRDGLCTACGWKGGIPAVSHKARCPVCHKEIRSRTDELTCTWPDGPPAQVSTAAQPPEWVQRVHKLVRKARQARLERLTKEPNLPRRCFLKDTEPCTLGKPDESTMPIGGVLLGRPAEITWRGDSYWIVAGGFYPGLRVNGRGTKEHQLENRDVIQLGRSRFEFRHK